MRADSSPPGPPALARGAGNSAGLFHHVSLWKARRSTEWTTPRLTYGALAFLLPRLHPHPHRTHILISWDGSLVRSSHVHTSHGCAFLTLISSPRTEQDSRPRKRKKRSKRSTALSVVTQRKRVPKNKRKIEYITIPKHWFADPLSHSMKTVVRPPTAKNRRKELKIEMNLPMECVYDLMKPLETDCVKGFKWMNETKTQLKPTSETKALRQYKYTIDKPALVDSLWRLEERETPARRRDGTIKPTRRGLGASRLSLSAAAADRGELSNLLAGVTGNVTIHVKEPTEERAMPNLKMLLKCSTMDKNGHIIWGQTFGSRTAAALRKQLRDHLSKMMASAEYPTLTNMTASLTQSSDSVLVLPPSAADLRAAQQRS